MNIPLNPKLFDTDIEQAPIRKGFGEGLLAAAEADPRVVGLCADLIESTQMHLLAKKFPERFVEMGVAEQNLASVASGMAAMGKIPFITSYAMFSPGRNWEQIRTTICYNNRPVIIAGSHAGVSVGPDGGTHQAIEDIALTRVVPNMTVIVPCDAIEAKKATIAAARVGTPVYIRLAREKTPIITTEATPFEIGKAQIVFRPEGDADVGIIATGALVYNAIMAAQELEAEGIKARVMNLATIKPIDRAAVIKLAAETKSIVTVEEHQVMGGMGSAVAEVLAEEHPTKIKFVGVRNLFGQSGTPDELIKHYGLDKDAIMKAVREARG
ncbi:MAG: transketolase [Candidatus Yonathbacteria bacterium RIFCSPHIGHO2_01_FULL_51_10]|uniref:Transketolase n=1 Tax=Candidatus Yonathbacteria bacterium RIFCSPHIGHO2_01_FULL_51_10 TaxID=1802723 RepID=A0A1G2S6B0_9BACT|nr:MAG: transketolase [Candidatus Yonathbacteria bacterium RIFCSPHIGHO2_01_FULL_51_10]